MKELIAVLSATAALTVSAFAADLPLKAPVVVPVASWTGCYIGGGGGYGVSNHDNSYVTPTDVFLDLKTTGGGRGYLGTVQGGCDYQFAASGNNFVVGAFADYDFAGIKGNVDIGPFSNGQEKLSSQYALGGRAGWLVSPNLLTYFSAGYTEAHYNGIALFNTFAPLGPTGDYIGSNNYQGFFLGAGDEYALGFLPGLFWKTEYRFSDLGTQTNPVRVAATGASAGAFLDSHQYVQTIRSELVYRFNWNGSAPATAGSAPRLYTKAPAPAAAVPNWTGCYVGGGGGYGMWNQDNTGFLNGPPRTQEFPTTTAGGRGYLGTGQAGCDYRLTAFGTNNLLVGAFGDYDFSSLKGTMYVPSSLTLNTTGDAKLSSAWSIGGRAGWLVTPSLLTYLSAGYTEANFDRVNFSFIGFPNLLFLNQQTYNGYFVGAGDEYALKFLPGLFWKTEYRFSDLGTQTNPIFVTATGAQLGESRDSHNYVQTVRSELVYRFNWSDPVVAKY
jgi:outer membrane immunogenic protein